DRYDDRRAGRLNAHDPLVVLFAERYRLAVQEPTDANDRLPHLGHPRRLLANVRHGAIAGTDDEAKATWRRFVDRVRDVGQHPGMPRDGIADAGEQLNAVR